MDLMDKGKFKSKAKPDRLKPLSLYPLTLEQALLAFMRTDPKKVQAAERRTQIRRPGK